MVEAMERVMRSDEGGMTDKHQDQPASRVHLQVIGDVQPGAGKIVIDARAEGGPHLTVSEQDMAFFRLTGNQAGWEAAARMVLLGAALQKIADVQKADLPSEGAELTDEDKQQLVVVCRYLHRAAHYLGREKVLEMTYNLLREGSVNRTQAAMLASVALGKKVETEAWRKAIDRFAETRGLPKVEIHKRRQGKTDIVN
jgi:hypothetical protein